MSDQFEFNFANDPPPDPPRIVDPEAAREITEDAIERAEHLTDDDRKAEMLEAIRRLAQRQPYLTADDVWVELGAVGDERDNGSGLGPVMRKHAIGIITTTGEYVRSQRPSMHGKPIPVWKSLIFVEVAA